METTKQIKVSILQMSSIIGDVDKNIEKVKTLVSENLDVTSDVLIMPEVWSVGWACNKFQQSTKYEHKIIEFLSNVAKKYSINIIAGSIITSIENKFYNTCLVFNRQGQIIAKYNKNHLYSYYGCEEGKYITRGDSGTIVDIEGIKFGLTICYDIRFPELYRLYAQNGADILVNCAAWGSKKSNPWNIMTKSRAIENQCYMIAVDQTGKIKSDEYNLGHSRVIDFLGEDLLFIDKEETVKSIILDVNYMYKVREKSPTLTDIKKIYEVI